MARYACADLHGRYDLAERVIAKLQPEDTLYFLGDAIDRGPYSWETLMLLLTHPQVEFFLGNHEDFLLKTALGKDHESVIIETHTFFRDDARYVWSFNGGNEMIQKCAELRERSPEVLHDLIKLLSHAHIELLLTNARNQNIHLTHAGYTFGKRPWTTDELIWNRSHIYEDWPSDPVYENIYLIHGHTPINHLCDFDGTREAFDGPLFYCNNHKIDIDLGSIHHGWTTMLNLDTFEYINIEGDHQYDLR